ncbi:sensor histidine kinase [Nocardioides acrostichi]|uniref:histidine kinase n=1 Tax=Nocardioides acrostichi TaxID=2784339 RepID=A0A930UU64_9ACTN|nr:HAMP domain-containing sensor histidine kinase [Nocardioides acrostichi]MBF4160256.1 HAMP domain-containing histidine kinase [Nocardioides acrostichi]
MSDDPPTGLRTPSLRRRTTLVVLALVGTMLVLLVVGTDLVLGNRLDTQLRQRLVDRATTAQALVGQVDSADLARRLEGDGISVRLSTSDGESYDQGPLATDEQGDLADSASLGDAPGPGADAPGPGGPPGPGQVVSHGDLLTVERTLDDGSRLTLLADASEVDRTMAQVRLALVIAALLVLAAAAVVAPVVVGRSLRPLDQITTVARSITDGDRRRRLHPSRGDTELGRTATAFDEMLDAITGAEQRATESEQRLRTFLSDVAHELRTPATSVQAAAEHLLRDDPDRHEREATTLALIREARRAGRLVDDMLLMSRIDTGLTLDLHEVDVAALVDGVVTARASRGGATTTVDDRAPAALAVHADADRVAQVLHNLLSNAERAAGPRGRVVCEISARGSWARLDVVDSGPGVSRANAEYVFERLVRLDAARDGASGGSGLGLAIARGIARAHGGDVRWVQPGAGEGARFRLTLPLAGRVGADAGSDPPDQA